MLKHLLTWIFLLSFGISFGQCSNDTLTIGQDTNLCTGESILLKADQAYISYLWNTGSTNASITVNSTGQYICNAKIQDSSNLIYNGDFFYGNMLFTSNYIYGTGGPWGLLSAEGQYAISTNASLTHNNFAACSDHTTGTGNFMIVNGSSTANQHLWCNTVTTQPATDYIFSAWFTSVTSSNPATLSFTINGSTIGTNVNLSPTTCLWQNFFSTWTSGATQTSANICITNQNTNGSGNDFGIDDIYFAQVCEFIDTVDVIVYDYPTFSLGNDTSLCVGDSLQFNINADSISTFLWQDSSTLSTYTSKTSDTLYLEVANGHCKSYDTLVLDVYDYPTVDLGPDTLICDGLNYVLDATWNNATYLWQDGTLNPILSANNTGLYWVEVDNKGCKTSDSVQIILSSGPTPDLGPDQTFCEGDSILLQPGIWALYLWNTGSQQAQLGVSPNVQTNYSVVVWDADGCSDSTDINLTPVPYPIGDIIINKDTVCLGITFQLEASGGDSYLWSTGETNPLIIVEAREPTLFSVQISNHNNGIECAIDTSIQIYVKDCNTLFLPNAFSPNDDGLNDTYGPKGEFDLESYEMFVYNRLGELIFYTQDVFEQWDGKDKDGKYLPIGVYTYLLNVKEPIRESYQLYGTVQLIS